MRLPISSLILVGIAGICLFLFVVFNHAYMGDDGLKDQLNESAHKVMKGDHLNRWDDNVDQLGQGFGIACVVCCLLALVFFVVEILGDERGGSY